MTVTTPPAIDAAHWLRRFRPPVHDTPFHLVCLPHAGGSASYFFPMAGALDIEIDVLAAQYPGRQDRHREPAMDDIEALADRLTAAVHALTDRDVVLLGHSMGALVAFEMARRLERDGRPPRHLVVSGRRPPSPVPRGEVHTWSDRAVIAELRALGGDEMPLPGDEVLQLALPAIRADYRALETYADRLGAPLNCPVTAMCGDRDGHADAHDMNGWNSHTTGAFAGRSFAGGHFYLGQHWDAAAELIRVL